MNRLSHIMSIIAAIWLIFAAILRILISLHRHYALDPLPFGSILIALVLIVTLIPARKAAAHE